MSVLQISLAAILGYLLGSVSPGYLLGRVLGEDLRKHGSGRTGGANVYRTFATKYSRRVAFALALLAAFGDFLKGLLAVMLARFVFQSPAAGALAGLGAIAGHNWALFLGFQGGVGAVTASGVLWALSPFAFAFVAPLSLMWLPLRRQASPVSISVALLTPMVFVGLAVAGKTPSIYIGYAIGTAVMMIYKLLPNIRRLREGTERRLW